MLSGIDIEAYIPINALIGVVNAVLGDNSIKTV
jgi:hypothetical protein